jgi:hypothetical protein
VPHAEKNASHRITTLNESPLHKAIKRRLSEPYDCFETLVDGYVVDIVRGDLLIEIQTANVAKIRRKLETLARNHSVRLVLPVTTERWIVRVDDAGDVIGRRRSPKHKRIEHIFDELVHAPGLLDLPGLTVEVLLTEEEELRRQVKDRRRRRGGWATVERRLIKIAGRHVLESTSDLLALLPGGLPAPFGTADVAGAAEIPVALARRMVYTLRAAGGIERVGKRGNALLYERIGSQQ